MLPNGVTNAVGHKGTIFQFLLGCFLDMSAVHDVNALALSIPSRMLHSTRGFNGLSSSDPFNSF